MGPSSVCSRPEAGVELGRQQSLSLGMAARAGTEEGGFWRLRTEGRRQKQLEERSWGLVLTRCKLNKVPVWEIHIKRSRKA